MGFLVLREKKIFMLELVLKILFYKYLFLIFFRIIIKINDIIYWPIPLYYRSLILNLCINFFFGLGSKARYYKSDN